MPSPSDFYSALYPAKNADLLREALFERVAYVLGSGESAQDLTATDVQSGAIIKALVQNGRIFAIDPLDTTTAHDGTATLVSADGIRYKLDDLRVPYAVLASDITSPPGSPSIGDAYLLIDPGTGGWSGLGPIVTYTSRGWESIDVEPGRLIYDEDGDQYYRVDSNGDILPGFGEGAISTGTLSPRHFLRDGDLFRFIVENQTTNTPPGSPTAGLSYIAGSSPTGAWTTPGYIYRYEAGAWREYAPRTGWVAYDKAQSLELIWTGSAWVSAAGGFANQQSFATSGAHTWNKPSSGTWALIEAWGGGGSGGARSGTGDAGGGGGGAYRWYLIRMAHLPSTLSVTVGAGGVARTGASNQNGADGTASSVAVSGTTIVEAPGGAGGANNNAGSNAAGGGGGSATDVFADAGGNGGSVASSVGAAGANSLRSGAGGGATGSAGAGAGGVSRLGGGNGGAAQVSAAGENGVAPGGGGAGARQGNASGAGAEGRVVITVW